MNNPIPPSKRKTAFLVLLVVSIIMMTIQQGGGFYTLMQITGMWTVLLMSAYTLSIDLSRRVVYRGKYSG